MSFTILSGKGATTPARSLYLCRIVSVDGDTVYLTTASTEGITSLAYGGHDYQCRIQQHDIEAIIAMSPQGYDIPGSVRLTIADSDFRIWTDHIKPHGWKGAVLTLTQVLWNVVTTEYSTDAYSWEFLLENPEPPTQGIITVGAVTRMSMTRVKIPSVARQRRCPWAFPSNVTQRTEGKDDPASIFFQCGYSPDLSGGVGNYESGATPFTDCSYTKQACVARGMYDTDSSARVTRRFGGDTWQAPIQYSGRQYTSGQKAFGFNTPNPPGKDFFPLVYGTQWVDAVVLEPALDPNTMRAEAIICFAGDGGIVIQKLLVNDVQIPQNNSDLNFNWAYINQGGRTGGITQGPIFDGKGDPHGSLAKIVFVVPVQLASSGVPSVKALVSGPPIATFDSPTLTRSFAYSHNPVWHALDLLTWGNWTYSQVDLQTFANSADFCDATMSYVDGNGASQTHERFRSSFALTNANRQVLAQAVLAVRASANLILARNPVNGLLQCFVKRTLAEQQGAPVAGSNYNTAVISKMTNGTTANGYVAYHFDGAGSIERGSLKLTTRQMNDTPNRISFQFQDSANEYQSDSISQIDVEAYQASGNQEIDLPLTVMGVENFDQATRISNAQLSEALRGNPRDDAGGTLYIEFVTSMVGSHLVSSVGAICSFSWEQLGIDHQLFRLLSVQPKTDGERLIIRGQWHMDDWYTDAYGQDPTPFIHNPQLGAENRPPWPWKPGTTASYGRNTFGISIDTTSYPAQIGIYGNLPVNVPVNINRPLVPLQATTANTGGTISPGTYVLAISFNGVIGPASRFVTAVVPAGTTTNVITVSGITWPSAATAVTVFAGPDSLHVTSQSNSVWTGSANDGFGNPTSITIRGISSNLFGLPDVNFSTLEIQQTTIVHGGTFGAVIDSIVVNHVSGHYEYEMSFTGVDWGIDQWAGYTLTLYYRPGVELQPIANLTLNGNDPAVLYGSSLSSGVFQVQDTVVMRAKASHITSNTIGDDNFVSSLGPTGLAVNAEAGNLVFIVGGTGQGQAPKPIASNTATVLTINGTWDITPDSSSVYIIIGSSFEPVYTSQITNDGTTRPDLYGTFEIASGLASKVAAQSILVQVATADANGVSFPMRYQPWREIYIPRQALGIGGGSGLSDYIDLVEGPDGTFTPDLALGTRFRILLTADSTLSPVVNWSVTAPTDWSLEIDQNGAGHHSMIFPDVYGTRYVTSSKDSPSNTRCVLQFTTEIDGTTYPTAAPSVDQPIP